MVLGRAPCVLYLGEAHGKIRLGRIISSDVAEEEREVTARAFRAYGIPLEMVTSL